MLGSRAWLPARSRAAGVCGEKAPSHADLTPVCSSREGASHRAGSPPRVGDSRQTGAGAAGGEALATAAQRGQPGRRDAVARPAGPGAAEDRRGDLGRRLGRPGVRERPRPLRRFRPPGRHPAPALRRPVPALQGAGHRAAAEVRARLDRQRRVLRPPHADAHRPADGVDHGREGVDRRGRDRRARSRAPGPSTRARRAAASGATTPTARRSTSIPTPTRACSTPSSGR